MRENLLHRQRQFAYPLFPLSSCFRIPIWAPPRAAQATAMNLPLTAIPWLCSAGDGRRSGYVRSFDTLLAVLWNLERFFSHAMIVKEQEGLLVKSRSNSNWKYNARLLKWANNKFCQKLAERSGFVWLLRWAIFSISILASTSPWTRAQKNSKKVHFFF